MTVLSTVITLCSWKRKCVLETNPGRFVYCFMNRGGLFYANAKLLDDFGYNICIFLLLFLLLFDSAKLRRFSSDSKKKRRFFSYLCGQTPHLWTYWGNRPQSCPNYALYGTTFWWHEYGKEAILKESDNVTRCQARCVRHGVSWFITVLILILFALISDQ